jgi:hypothetical protein
LSKIDAAAFDSSLETLERLVVIFNVSGTEAWISTSIHNSKPARVKVDRIAKTKPLAQFILEIWALG